MLTSSVFTRAAAAAAMLLAVLPFARAQAIVVPADTYISICEQSVQMPKPYGEWDLKGNAKLPTYCKCYSALFAARASKAATFMKANPGKQLPGNIEQTNAEERAMRVTCRKQTGLPVPSEVK